VIRVFLLDRYRETIDSYVQMWARSLDPHLRAIAYESLSANNSVDAGVFIFSDLERLKEAEYQRADVLARAIESAGGRVLNKPSRVLRRYPLLRMLHDTGRNPFNVYHVREIDADVRYPVFIRRERSHAGALTPLLKNRDELNRALWELQKTSEISDDLLIVEYVHTADIPNGLFRKYSAMLIDQTLIARHILFSKDWMDKDADVVTDQGVIEENKYVSQFPHAGQVRDIFKLAGIDYGRIDYSLLNGKVVTWEINTNPRILPSPGKCDPRRLYSQGNSAKLVREAFDELAKSKSVTVSLSECEQIIDREALSPARRMIYAGSHFWRWAGQTRIGRRVIEGLASSIGLGMDHNSQWRRL
jgi:hypothetical protein